MRRYTDKLDNTAFLVLLNKASPEFIRQALQIKSNVPHSLAWIGSQINAAMTPAALEPWLVLLLKLSGMKDTWSADKPLTELSALLVKIKLIPDPFLQQIAEYTIKRLSILTPSSIEAVAATTTGIQTIALADGHTVSLSDVGLLENIQANGLASWDDFYLLKKYSDTHADNQPLLSLLNLMSRYNTLKPSSLKPSIHHINKELFDGNLLMKTFSGWQPKAWSGFVQQLETPWERASLRKQLNGLERLLKPEETHKFHHLTGETSPYLGKQIRPKLEHRTHVKKQSMTLISPEKCTPLFQSQQPETLLVGIAFRADPTIDKHAPHNPRKAKIRAMILSDQGTYHREWRGSEQEVNKYAEKAKNYTSLTDFKTAIKQNIKHTNEVLAQPSKESLLGIVVGRDTPKARKLARQYQQDIQNKLGLTLPIILYDAERKLLIEDLDLFENLKTKEDLIDEREVLLKTKSIVRSHRIYAFLSGEGVYEGKTYPGDVLKRLRDIDTNLAQINAKLHQQVNFGEAPSLDDCLGLPATLPAVLSDEPIITVAAAASAESAALLPKASAPGSTTAAQIGDRDYPYKDDCGRYRFIGAGAGALKDIGAGAGALKEYERDEVASAHSAAGPQYLSAVRT